MRARREQMEAQRERLGPPEGDWWAGRTGMLSAGIGDPLTAPPFGTQEVAARLSPTDTVLDIGGGAGRYAVPLLGSWAEITVLEPSAALAALAREHLARAGAVHAGAVHAEDGVDARWEVVEAQWPQWGAEAPERRFDLVLLAHVLYPHEDLRAWVRAADAVAGRWVCIVHGTVPDAPNPVAGVISAYHGEPRIPQPELADLIPALHELGYFPDVRMGERRFRRTFDAAHWPQEVAREALIPPERDELRRIRRRLRPHLEDLGDGRVALPEVTAPVALLTWRTDR